MTSLPTLDNLPDADVVIFDGHCRFCLAQVERIYRFDGGQRLAFVSLHDPVVAERWTDLTQQQLMDALYIIDQDGTRHSGAAAFRYLTRRLPKLWLLAPLMHIPFSLPLWQLGYHWIARQRYRWGKTVECDGAICKVHLEQDSGPNH